MRTVTVEMIMNANPCPDYPRERVEELFAGREELTLDELLALDIPVTDRWWAFYRSGMATDREYRLIACDIAEEIAMPIWRKYHPNDDRPQRAIDTARKFANGEATLEEMATARDAASAAACAAAFDAAMDAACDTAWVASRAAAWDTARDKILEIARRYK